MSLYKLTGILWCQDNANTTHTSVFVPGGAAVPVKSAVGGSAAAGESVVVAAESAAVAGTFAAAERRSFAAVVGRPAAE